MKFSDRLAVGGVRTHPTGVEGNRRLAVLEKVPNEPSIALSFSFRGYLAPLSRRLYQPENRFSSVSRPFHNVSGAASPSFEGARIHQITTISLRRLVLRFVVCGWGVWVDGRVKCEVVESRGDGGGGESVSVRGAMIDCHACLRVVILM